MTQEGAEKVKAKVIADLSPDAVAIRNRLNDVPVGGFVSYAELSEIIGADVQWKRRAALDRARAILMRDREVVFGIVKGEGIKRLSDEEVATLGLGFVRHIRRTSSKGMRTLSCVQHFNNLTGDAKIAHNASMSVLATMHQFAAPKKMKGVEDAVRTATSALPVAKVLELFT